MMKFECDPRMQLQRLLDRSPQRVPISNVCCGKFDSCSADHTPSNRAPFDQAAVTRFFESAPPDEQPSRAGRSSDDFYC